MLYRIFLCCCVLSLAWGIAPGQSLSGSRLRGAERRSSDDSKDDSDVRIGSPENEMIRKRQLEYAKKNYEEHLGRCREVARLGAALRVEFAKSPQLDKEDAKRLERIEKLAKRIREQMSEESNAQPLQDNFPATLEEALTRLDTVAQELEKMTVATPRLVVSTAVMEKANEVEAVARYIREHWPAK
jgi:hypothetical protein